MEKDTQIKAKADRLMELITKCYENGGINIFSALFQTDLQCIFYLYDRPNAHPSDMATALKSTRPNIAANLRILEQKGYIVRTTDEINRRQIYVNLTEKGRNYYSLCRKQMYMLFATWFSILGEEDTEHLFEILEKSSDPVLMSIDLDELHTGEDDEIETEETDL